jgi:ABC-type branched-subunit amino acid transport system ATPase component
MTLRSDVGEGLLANDVTVRFGGLTALNCFSLEAPLGQITGLIGPNGAGKTTFFDVCSGFRIVDEGQVRFCGREVSRASPASRARLGIGRTFQRLELFDSMTVRQNIALGCEAGSLGQEPLSQLGITRNGRSTQRAIVERTDAILERTGLSAVKNEIAGELPIGTGRIVEVARALARGPKILLLDEPSSGLDVEERKSFTALVASLARDDGLGVLLVEHDMEVVLGLCYEIYVLDFGRHLFRGTPTEVRNSADVRAAYLGQVLEQ